MSEVRFEQCQHCYKELPIDGRGRIPRHRRAVGSAWEGDAAYSMITSTPTFCPKSGHPSREEMQRRRESRRDQRLATAALVKDDARVALDAFIEGRATDYDGQIADWRRAALTVYNMRNGTKYPHAYEYATRCQPQSRRAHTLGDVYCRICGERLFVQVKDPHKLVRESAEAQRHLTICALQLLAEMREPAKPGHRATPMECWF